MKQPGRDGKVVVATVLEELPRLVWRVELEKGRQVVLAHAGAAARGERNFLRLLPGDRVEVDVSPHDLTRGRIVRKIQNESTRIGKEDLR
jgi:translation initiation factor IF-1